MSYLATLKKSFFTSSSRLIISFLFGLGLTTGLANLVFAETPETAPQELTELLSQIEQAANAHELEKLMQFYSEDFQNSDGLRYSTLNDALTKLWKRYPQVTYKTELQSWQKVGDEIVAETITSIQGNDNSDGRVIKLDSTIRSRQHFQNEKLVRQEILSEDSQVTSGEKPPQIKVLLPEYSTVGQQFNFDVILEEPLGDEVVLGAAIEEKTAGDLYINPTAFELDLLPAGGIFKVVKAPLLPNNLWLSAILIKSDGISMITRRVRIEK